MKEIKNLEDGTESGGYRIGAVSALTGISPDALRVWEKRYAIVTPSRTASGNRIYSAEDLTRLSLIKQLLDAGDSIGNLVKMDIPSLQSRAATLRHSQLSGAERLRPCQVVVVGVNMALRLAEAAEQLPGLRVIGACDTPEQLAEIDSTEKPDVVIYELPSLNDASVDKVLRGTEQLAAPYSIVVYRFSNDKILRRLTSARSITLRAPIELATLQRHCEAIMRQVVANAHASSLALPALGEPVAARLYDDAALARIANISSTIKCECPHHLAELIMALNAFETYSAQCENQNVKDAALHAYLHHATAQARHTMEKALEHLVEVEKISA